MEQDVVRRGSKMIKMEVGEGVVAVNEGWQGSRDRR